MIAQKYEISESKKPTRNLAKIKEEKFQVAPRKKKKEKKNEKNFSK